MRQITVVYGPEHRRRWNDEERLRILVEAFTPGACVADVARLHDISTAGIYTWRSKLRQQIAMPKFGEAVVVAGEPCSPEMSAPVIVVELGGEEAGHLCAAKLAPDENGTIAPYYVNLKNASSDPNRR